MKLFLIWELFQSRFIMINVFCSGRNNTDLVGVTWPRAGAQKSRVGQEQYPRIAGQIAIWASGGSESGSERPPCCVSIYRRSRDNGECAIAATAVRSKGVEMAIMT
ncbi:putative Alpha-amylase [Trichinella spiralis]|uniref:putative Alpha-amylase n=1 Tax=Trichinella spiralis TaxID=6334 RepID=UPI0001EFE76B|nr:putative Alpha-amylase [Trichinella spiralis]